MYFSSTLATSFSVNFAAKYCNVSLYYWLLLSLSDDVNLVNPRLSHNLQQLDHEGRNICKHRVLHFCHIIVNSFLPEIDNMRYIVKLTDVAVIGILNENSIILSLHQEFKILILTCFVVAEIDMEEGQLAVSNIIMVTILMNHIL